MLRYRRRRPGRCGRSTHTSLLQRCILLGASFILGSTDFLLPHHGGRHSAWTAAFAAAQSVESSGSYSASCDGHQEPRPGAIYSAVGHLNYGVGLDLKADISIPGACEVNFPIDVSSGSACAVQGKHSISTICSNSHSRVGCAHSLFSRSALSLRVVGNRVAVAGLVESMQPAGGGLHPRRSNPYSKPHQEITCFERRPHAEVVRAHGGRN